MGQQRRSDDGAATDDRAATALTVGDVADRLGVTVRTLHHYDEIGLVRPTHRSRSGYRLYSEADLTRLQHVVVYRRLGFPLEQIARLLDAARHDVVAHLQRQREAVAARMEEMNDLVTAIDRALEKELNGMKISKEEQRELFGEGYDEAYATEAEQRWGDTAAWKQSQTRVSTYDKNTWVKIKDESDTINSSFAQAMASGISSTSDEAMDLAEEHRQHINRWFYDCPPQMHRGVTQLYVSDPRFARTYDQVAPGLGRYVSEAAGANAERHQDQG